MDTAVKKKSLIQDIAAEGGFITVKGLDKDAFIRLSGAYPELSLERKPDGNIIVMTPVKGGSGMREHKLSLRIGNYCEKHLGGLTFSPSTGFDLPDGSTRSPDIAWIGPEKLSELSAEALENEFIPLVPDFVAELRSKSDALPHLRAKMTGAWIANGVRLAWLIDPYEEKAWIYRQNGSVEVVEGFDGKLSGEEVLPGFELELGEFRLMSK